MRLAYHALEEPLKCPLVGRALESVSYGRRYTMSTIATRQFLLDSHNVAYQLPLATFARMHQDPAKHAVVAFAGVRARGVEVSVELVERRPCRVLRTVFFILNFDKRGILDVAAYDAQQFASVATAVNPVFRQLSEPAPIIDASHHFIASAGRWQPSEAEQELIRRAALGKLKCRRLKIAVAR